jgi:hypothetical protein
VLRGWSILRTQPSAGLGAKLYPSPHTTSLRLASFGGFVERGRVDWSNPDLEDRSTPRLIATSHARHGTAPPPKSRSTASERARTRSAGRLSPSGETRVTSRVSWSLRFRVSAIQQRGSRTYSARSGPRSATRPTPSAWPGSPPNPAGRGSRRASSGRSWSGWRRQGDEPTSVLPVGHTLSACDSYFYPRELPLA